MHPKDTAQLILLAALWGGSFLFMRIAAPQFGPLPLVEMRLGVAVLFLLPFVNWSTQWTVLRAHLGAVVTLGLINSGIPFVLFSYAMLSLPAGFTAIVNATAPLWAALVGYLWFHESLTRLRILGLLVGFGGVLLLVLNRGGALPGHPDRALLACLCATLLYGISANYARHRLPIMNPATVSAGSLLAAAVVMLPAAIWSWPATVPAWSGWMSAGLLAIFCTAVPYLVYFALLPKIGPLRIMTVAFLIPVFGLLWGALFLGETVTASMLGGCTIILLGTALASGLLGRRRAQAEPPVAGVEPPISVK